jgi:hypothetical protein
LRACLLFFALSAMIVGCGRRQVEPAAVADSAPAARPLIDACALLPYSDAEAIAGEQLRRMSTALDTPTGADFAKCSYGNPARLGVTISLEVRRHPSVAVATEVQESSRARLGTLAGEWQPIADLPGAEEAFWADGRLDQLHARRGALRLIVTVTMGEEAGRRDAARAIAAETLARLADVTATP